MLCKQAAPQSIMSNCWYDDCLISTIVYLYGNLS